MMFKKWTSRGIADLMRLVWLRIVNEQLQKPELSSIRIGVAALQTGYWRKKRKKGQTRRGKSPIASARQKLLSNRDWSKMRNVDNV